MKLDDLKFWVSPLTHTLFVGTISKRHANTANQSRDITGLMINGIVEMMRLAKHTSFGVEQEGKRYRLTLSEEVSVNTTSQPENEISPPSLAENES